MPARSARVSAGVVPSRSVTLSSRRQRGERRGTSPAAAVGERAEPHRARTRLARRRARAGRRRARRGPGSRAASRRAPAGVSVTPCAAAVEQAAAGGRLERGDLPRDGRLRVAERRAPRPRTSPACATSRSTRRPVGEKSVAMREAHGRCAYILVVDMADVSYGEAMTASRIALVTGANQGLGRALVEGLAAGLAPQDRVLLTGRDPDRVAAAAARSRRRRRRPRRGPRARRPRRRGHRGARRRARRGRHRVLQRHRAHEPGRPTPPTRSTPSPRPAISRPRAILRAFAPRLRPGRPARSSWRARSGRSTSSTTRVAGRFAAAAEDDLDAVDALVAEWRQRVHEGRAEDEGFGAWLNIPSKVAQVAAVRAVARERRAADLAARPARSWRSARA